MHALNWVVYTNPNSTLGNQTEFAVDEAQLDAHLGEIERLGHILIEVRRNGVTTFGERS